MDVKTITVGFALALGGMLAGNGASAQTVEGKTIDLGTVQQDAGSKLQSEKLAKVATLLREQQPKKAIGLANEIIEYFERKYAEPNTAYFSARTPAESLLYMLTHAKAVEKSGAKRGSAVAVDFSWSAAHFMKGYAYMELDEVKKARASILKAIDLAPMNGQYQIEMGQTYLKTQHLNEALEWFKRAENSAVFASDEGMKNFETVRALRGQAFVYIEQKKYDEAEALLLKCKKIAPNDKRTDEELELIRNSR